MDAAELDALIAGLSGDEDSEERLSERHDDVESILASSRNSLADPVKGLSVCVDIDSTLSAIGSEIHRLYAPRLPKWDSEDLSEYVKVVCVLGPELKGRELLPQAVGKTRSIEIETAIVDDKGVNVDWACITPLLEQVKELTTTRESLLSAAQDQLEAPNLFEIVEPRTVVELLAWCGGLRELASANPSNLPSIGRPKSRRGGLAEGVLGRDPLLMSLPSDTRLRATKLVAAKVVLAARMDLAGSSPNGSQGRKWKRNIENRLDRLLAPPPSVRERALAIPEESNSKRRGGRRIRRARERYAPSEAEKQQKRIAFAESAGAGPIRRPVGTKSNLRISKAVLERLKKTS